MKNAVTILAALMSILSAETRGQAFVPISYETAGVATTTGLTGEPSMHYRSLAAGAAIPLSIGSERLIAGLRYDRVKFDYERWPDDTLMPEAVHHVRMELIYMHIWPGAWQTTLLAAPGWASEFATSLHADDFNMALAALVSRKLSDRLTTGLGLSYVKDRAPVVLPVVQLLWQSERRWSSEVMAPSAAHLWYQPRIPLKAGLAWRAIFLPYNLNDPDREDVDGLLRRQVFSVGPAVRIPIAGAISLQVMGGLTLRNRLVFVAKQESLTMDHDNRFFFWTGLVVQSE